MGSELSCPCGTNNQIDREDTPKEQTDIIEEVMKGKLLPQNITYEYTYKQTKVCLIKTEELEGFFANRNILKLVTKKEINYYYNLVFITNFMGLNNQVFVLLQYTQGNEDRSFIKSSSYYTKNKKRNSTVVDYSTYYKIEKINLVSVEKSKVKEQIINDLNMNAKKDFLFYGIVNDSDEPTDYSTTPKSNNISSRVAAPRNFKVLYKRSLLKENLECKYSILHYEGTLDRDIINDFVSSPANKFKVLKAIMIDSALDNSILKKNYYFIFEESRSFPEHGYDNLVIEMEQGNNSNKMLIEDIANKLNNFQLDYKLCCIVCEEKKIYIILNADQEAVQSETPIFN